MIHRFIVIFKECKADKVGAYAAQSAFFIVLSAIPFLVVLTSLIAITTLGKGDVLEVLNTFCPDYILPLLISIIDEVYEHSAGLLSISAVVAVWSAAKGVQAIANGLNEVYDVAENRNWFVLRFWAIIYTLLLMVVLLFLLAFMVFGKDVKGMAMSHWGTNSVIQFFESWLKWLVMLAVSIVLFCFTYKALPNRKLSLRGQFPGAAFCALGWLLFSFGLSVYVNYFNGFSMYGSLTTIVLVMFWIYVCMYIFLIGAELNALFLQKRI